MSDLLRCNFGEKSERKLTQQIEKELCYEVEEMVRKDKTGTVSLSADRSWGVEIVGMGVFL